MQVVKKDESEIKRQIDGVMKRLKEGKIDEKGLK